MKKIKKLLFCTALSGIMASCAMAADAPAKIEAYAHPTMFGNQVQETVSATSDYIVGGKIMKKSGALTVFNKNQVVISSWVNDMMCLIREKQFGNGDGFNEKMPVLRSELAVILSEGFNLKNTSVKKQYKDISSSYWAKDWINGALNANVMIGYPDNNFRPDQPVTKAEVFATIAQLIDVKYGNTSVCLNGKQMKYVPKWANNAAKEIIASKLLDYVPNQDKIVNDEYLSKEQVAYLVGTLRANWSTVNSIGRSCNAHSCIKNFSANVLKIKLEDRLSARTSNVGDKFTAKTTADTCVSGKCFKKGSSVKGEVIEVVRPGVNNLGYIKIKFSEIKDGDTCVEMPKNISMAEASVAKNPNVVARIFGFPFSEAGRIAGVAGRSVSSGATVISNSAEAIGANLSDTFVNTLSLQPIAGAKSFGRVFVNTGKGIYNVCELLVSGVFGLLYETGDEFRYLIVPQYSNSSSLNPGEELTILF